MRIAVISDTHIPRAATALSSACLAQLVTSDAIIHAGDHSDLDSLDALRGLGPPVIAVHGNVDSDGIRRELPADAVLETDGMRVAVTHDAGAGPGRARRMARRFPDVDGIVFGHSHIPLQHAPQDGPWLLNPGSPTDRRRQPHHTMAMLDLRDGTMDVRFLVVDGEEAAVLPDDLIRGRGQPAE